MADFAEDNDEVEETDITKDAEYADLTPIKQDDGEHPVVAIRYAKEFADVHNYFRAIIHKNELSLRALKLTERVIRLNPANYTAWQFRRECIFKLNYDLQKELEFSRAIAVSSPKNYQLWWHRRIIIEAITKASSAGTESAFAYDLSLEKELLRSILKGDAKNYHAWSHYHWLLRTYKLYEDELEYLEQKLLLFDSRNNSAWNHRHFVVKESTGFKDVKVLQREIAFCQEKIQKLATNHAVWYYYTQIVCVYLKQLCKEDGKLSWSEYRADQVKWVQSVLDKQPYAARATLFYVDLLRDKETTNVADLGQAKMCLALLAEKIDRIRCNYYQYLIKGIEAQIQQLQKAAK
mmetsp:Transcript_33318/g.53395  ORF Transcript_33318/g.53395 Transcript_33318/m.53395 type:complete len:349 (-) Transcript_33318:94-1140(-)